MSYQEWANSIGHNDYGLVKFDPETPPAKMRVVTWSNVFGAGGTVAIEAYNANGDRISSSAFAQITIEKDGSVADEREHLQDILDAFLEDLPNNWHDLISDARERITERYKQQAAEYAELAENAANGVFK